jgi:hypothetical protein
MMMQNAFHEWFLLPGNIAIGTVWQDTLKGEISHAGIHHEIDLDPTFRVARDSTVSGMRVLVIETAGTTETSGGGTMGGLTSLKSER